MHNLDALVTALRAHRVRPTVRIVFQQGEPPGSYRAAVRRISPYADILGLLLDSTAVRTTSVAQVRARARAYVHEFARDVDIWEIGNELNGEWLGSPASINAKVAAAYDVIEVENAALGLRSAITLNYWPSHDCYAHDWEATLPFARQLPERVRRGSDYVLLSFYETACAPPAHPSAADFARVLRAVGSIAPQAKLGIGEIGAQGKDDGLPRDPSLAEKQRVARTYYGMHRQLRSSLGPRFVGGYFWWYYATDAVPRDRPGSLWPTLDALLTSLGGGSLHARNSTDAIAPQRTHRGGRDESGVELVSDSGHIAQIEGGGLLGRRRGAAESSGQIAPVLPGQRRVGQLLPVELGLHRRLQPPGRLLDIATALDPDRFAHFDEDRYAAAPPVPRRLLGPHPLRTP